MPIIIGYAKKKEMKKIVFNHFFLKDNQSKGLGIKKLRKKDKLVLTYIPLSSYKKMNPENWENCFVIDERDNQEQLDLGL